MNHETINPLIYPGLTDQGQLQARLGRKLFTADDIILKTCEILGVSLTDFISHSRRRPLVEARTIAIGLILEVNKSVTLKQLGRKMGGRDHSTIIYCRETYADLLGRDIDFTRKAKLVIENV